MKGRLRLPVLSSTRRSLSHFFSLFFRRRVFLLCFGIQIDCIKVFVTVKKNPPHETQVCRIWSSPVPREDAYPGVYGHALLVLEPLRHLARIDTERAVSSRLICLVASRVAARQECPEMNTRVAIVTPFAPIRVEWIETFPERAVPWFFVPKKFSDSTS